MKSYLFYLSGWTIHFIHLMLLEFIKFITQILRHENLESRSCSYYSSCFLMLNLVLSNCWLQTCSIDLSTVIYCEFTWVSGSSLLLPSEKCREQQNAHAITPCVMYLEPLFVVYTSYCYLISHGLVGIIQYFSVNWLYTGYIVLSNSILVPFFLSV